MAKMGSAPVISIVMPVYNAGRHLRPAVASIFAQTFEDWELIAVDDASTDGSWEFLRAIDDPRVRLARNDRNMKQSFTQSRAIDMARGRVIARMDADDMSMPTRLERQIEALEAHPDIDVLGCGVFRIDADMRLITVTRPLLTHDRITRWPSLKIRLCHGALLGKAEWFRKWRPDPRIRLAQDFDFLFRAHRESTFGNIPDQLYVIRIGGVTAPLSQRTIAVYYRCLSLLRNGFRMGIPGTALLGLACHLPLPLVYAYKAVVGDKTGFTKASGVTATEAEERKLKEGLEKINSVQIPLRPSAPSATVEGR